MLDRVYARFTERARQVVALAQDAARDFEKHQIDTEHVLLGLIAEREAIDTEHVLLGLIAEREGLAAWALGSLGVELEETYEAVGRLVASGRGPMVGQVPFTPRAKRVIELANVEVDRRRLNFVGTEHVLLGLAAELEQDPDDDVALRVLSEKNVTPQQIRAIVERFVPIAKGGLSWMLRRTPGVEFRGIHGAGWIDVLELQPDVHLRRLLVRAAAAAMDDERRVIEVRDLLAACSDLPEGAQLLDGAGVTAPRTHQPSTAATERDWTRIDAGEHVLAAVIGAQRRTRENKRSTVMLDDLLLALATEQASLLSRSGWEISALRTLLERRREPPDLG
jgi:ATP-dependent Clp protease ATP-binding subunit ClpA